MTKKSDIRKQTFIEMISLRRHVNYLGDIISHPLPHCGYSKRVNGKKVRRPKETKNCKFNLYRYLFSHFSQQLQEVEKEYMKLREAEKNEKQAKK